MPSLRLPIVINREIDNALKRVSESTRIPVSTLARDAIIDMLARHGEVVENVPKPGGNRYKSTQDTAEDSTIDQDKAEAGIVEHDTPKLANKPALQHGAPSLPPLGWQGKPFSKAAQAGSNGKRRNGASGEE